MSGPKRSLRDLKAVLIDLSGTVHIGSKPTPNAVEALSRLRASGVPFRLCSNTTKESEADLLARLRDMKFDVRERELFTSLGAARDLLKARGLKKPLLLLSESAKKSFEGVGDGGEEHDCVVVGLAPEELSYDRLNQAFRILSGERPSSSRDADWQKEDDARHNVLIATHKATYYRADDGALSLGPGPFVSALEQAADVQAEVVGKPSRSFFEQTLRSLADEGVEEGDWGKVAIVGDDVKGDLGEGAVECGLVRVLVKTGKYRDGDEGKGEEPPDFVADSFSHFVDQLLDK